MTERKLRDPNICPFCKAPGCTDTGCLSCGAGCRGDLSDDAYELTCLVAAAVGVPMTYMLPIRPVSQIPIRLLVVEKIARAAALISDEVWSVEVPGRHTDILKAHLGVRGSLPLGSDTKRRWDQGFVTTTGRFVDRIEGGKLALESGQIEELSWPPNLYSEDLW